MPAEPPIINCCCYKFRQTQEIICKILSDLLSNLLLSRFLYHTHCYGISASQCLDAIQLNPFQASSLNCSPDTSPTHRQLFCYEKTVKKLLQRLPEHTSFSCRLFPDNVRLGTLPNTMLNQKRCSNCSKYRSQGCAACQNVIVAFSRSSQH